LNSVWALLIPLLAAWPTFSVLLRAAGDKPSSRIRVAQRPSMSSHAVPDRHHLRRERNVDAKADLDLVYVMRTSLTQDRPVMNPGMPSAPSQPTPSTPRSGRSFSCERRHCVELRSRGGSQMKAQSDACPDRTPIVIKAKVLQGRGSQGEEGGDGSSIPLAARRLRHHQRQMSGRLELASGSSPVHSSRKTPLSLLGLNVPSKATNTPIREPN
jgi:hypothetical protein